MWLIQTTKRHWIESCHHEWVNDLEQSSRSFKLFLSENKCSLLFWFLIESLGNLKKDDIADDLTRPLKDISATLTLNIVCVKKYSIHYKMYQVNYNCHIQAEHWVRLVRDNWVSCSFCSTSRWMWKTNSRHIHRLRIWHTLSYLTWIYQFDTYYYLQMTTTGIHTCKKIHQKHRCTDPLVHKHLFCNCRNIG